VETHLGVDALVFMGLYLCVMLTVGWLGRRSRKEESLRDFYLAGSSFGFAVLFLTLFATQYSGNTLLGFAGRSYRQGATYIVSLTFMILVISLFMVFAPRLFRLSRKFGYITPADYVFHRFGSHPIRILTVILLCWGLANYILEQLVAMGHGVEAISNGRLTQLIVAGCEGIGLGGMVDGVETGQLDFMGGVLLLALVMLVYESLGGMRAVAWTDVIQGLLLFGGCGCILYVLLTSEGGLPGAAAKLQEVEPEKIQTPDWGGLRVWGSNLVLIGLGVALYPHAIQRIFAARSLLPLRKSLAAMAFMPLVTTLLAFLIGYVGLSKFRGLEDSDKITIYVLTSMGKSLFTYWLVVIVLTAVVAAIMSTVDSALLSLSSMFTKDIYKVYIRRDATARHYLIVGKAFGWGLMVVLILGTYVSLKTESSIWLLIKLKLEFMVQLSPVFMLGLFWKRLPAWAVLGGIVAGTLITLILWGGAAVNLWSAASRSPFGISAGVWGLAVNYGICVVGTLMTPAPVRTKIGDSAVRTEE
jgi:SSS family solute:Na+ symporter/sodium/pantothenate symporter